MAKKYIMLFSFTLLAILGIWFSADIIKGQVADVNAIQLTYTSVENTITCSGKVQAAKGKDVFVDSTSVVRDIIVGIGDSVKSGDKLMNVVKAEVPVAALPSSDSNLFGLSNMPNLSSLDPETIETYKQILNNKSSSKSSNSTSSNIYKNEGPNLQAESVIAPIDGVVTAINVEPGDTCDVSTVVATVSEDNNLEICLPVNEGQISDIKVGQAVNITGLGFKGSQYNGTVIDIADSAKQSVSTSGQETVVEVLVSIDGSSECEDLKTGFTAKCKIVTSRDDNILIIPYEAVNSDDKGNEYIYKCIENKAVKSYVKTGKEFDSGFEILEGANANDIVILNIANINDGDEISIIDMKAGDS